MGPSKSFDVITSEKIKTLSSKNSFCLNLNNFFSFYFQRTSNEARNVFCIFTFLLNNMIDSNKLILQIVNEDAQCVEYTKLENHELKKYCIRTKFVKLAFIALHSF
jgi:hypothetical protein